MEKIKILAVYRGKIDDQRGTPIRVRSLLTRLNKRPDINLIVASWDKEIPNFTHHLFLSNNHLKDLAVLYRYVKNQKIQVVIGHTVATSWYLVPLALFTKAKVVLEMHGFIEDEAREYGDIGVLKYLLYKIWFGIFYWAADLITTCSKSVTNILLHYNKNVVSMCGGVDLSIFNPHVTHGRFITHDDRIIIGYAGNTRTWQGVDFLVRVYEKIRTEHHEFRLAMLLSEKADFGSHVEVFGPVENKDVPSFLIDCDVLVIPRPDTPVTKISFPSKLPEYLGMGKPVIVSKVGDMDEVVVNGKNGLIYTPEDEKEFLQHLLLIRDEKLRASLGQAAWQTAQNLSWERLTNFLVDKIKEIL